MEQVKPGPEQGPKVEVQLQRMKAHVYDLNIERGRHVTAANEIQGRIQALAAEIAKLEAASADGGEQHE